MAPLLKSDAPSGSSPLTMTIGAILALAAAAGLGCCLVYAVWWLITFWAPW
jgi:hypothetical protein